MPLAITLPLNPDVLDAGGPYPRALNVLSRKQTAVQRQLRRAGLAGYEPTTQATLLALAQQAPEGSAVYDIGAHIGLYSALISAVYGNGGPRAIAFEPTPETAALCRRIRECNRLGFEVQQTALADEPGTAELYFSLKSESSNSLNPAHRRHTESVEVPVTTVDAFTEERALTPHLIKIDVETLEAAVLRGSYDTIRRHRPWIVCELLPGADHNALRTALAPLTAMDYGLHPITPEAPWHRYDETTYRSAVSGQCRDWLLAPRPLTPAFHRVVRRWLIAILACDETTNIITTDKASFPYGWNAPYRSPRGAARVPRTRLLRLAGAAALARRAVVPARRSPGAHAAGSGSLRG
ncbi:FkbM family methyltransferase [Streptomyces malaysiensis]|uniref:FkbM family methyltransferase n=1 Tax=Streptomyces malaysiensis subsp. samsunensis TaxID=459658 RepID=A0A9X2M379_STRMQ|nr:FkbM family methyltransferase [Streptomyces samsunensis]MCQ8834216.1 FkbM family methyltransferase [Streptomyces samsunensis]